MTDRELRQRLVDRLERTRVLTDARVERALLTVPRHRFIAQVPLEAAYEDRAISIKERSGEIVSSISQPGMIVQMLQLLDVTAGAHVLEIGTGSGYNAALLAELTGPEGHVLTVDIEEDLSSAARGVLRDLGYANVRVDEAAALDGVDTPFDRIIVTARAADVDGAWWRLLRDGGKIVVPLDIGYGGERAFGFVRSGSELHEFGSYACAFIGMRSQEDQLATRLFFPNKTVRYDPATVDVPFTVTAVKVEAATPEMMQDADVIVARPQTIFAIRF